MANPELDNYLPPPRLIIVEGPDATGKTSLAKFIARELDGIYMHASGKKSLWTGMMDYHLNMVENAEWNMLNMRRSVVFDRHWPSEWAYGQVLRPHVSNTVYDFTKMRLTLRKFMPTYIFCESHTSFKRQLESHDQADHRYGSAEYSMIYGEYVMTRKRMESEVEFVKHVHTYEIERDGADLKKFMDEVLR